MARNGSGTYSLPANSWYPAVSGVSATFGDWNTTAADIQTALTQSVSADGQTVMTGDLNFNSTYRPKNVANASATGHPVVYGQSSWSLAAGTFTGTVTGTALTLSGAITATGGGTFGTAAYVFTDSFLQIAGSLDATKLVKFEVDGLTTATTRTVTVPDRDITLNTLTTVTNALGADVALNNTANFFDGPSVAQGTSGTWFASGTVTIEDTAGGVRYLVKLHDGTTVIASTYVTISTAAYPTPVSLSGYISNPAGNIRISVRDTTSTSGFIRFNATGLSKDSTLSAVRVA